MSLRAETGGSAAGHVIAIKQCVVYPEQAPTQTVDCVEAARAVCDGHTPPCELPIGLGLTGGKDIAPGQFKKVKVWYDCGGEVLVHGPHHQNAHAAMIMGCF